MNNALWCTTCDDLFVDWVMDQKLAEMDRIDYDEMEKTDGIIAVLATDLESSTQLTQLQNREMNRELTLNGSNTSDQFGIKKENPEKINLTNEENAFLDMLIETIEKIE